MNHYACYGITISSDIALPDLAPGDPESAADVIVRHGTVQSPAAEELLQHGLWRIGDTCGFEIPGVGGFEARGGTEIVVDLVPDADERTVRLYLMGTALGATMMLRGTLVLHGNSFRIGDAAAVVLGRSGAGKSTLAAEFDRRGFDVLSDDVVPVDAAGMALPGYPRIKLWPDALDRLGHASDELERVHAEVEKFHLPLDRGELEPLPLRWIYVLERHLDDDLVIEPAQGSITFALLHEHTYRNELVHGVAAVAQHLQQCADLRSRARVRRVLRPAETMTAEATAAAILADIDADQSGNPSGDESPEITPRSSQE